MFQYHQAHGIHHFCCGASGAQRREGSGFYGGIDLTHDKIEWICPPEEYGFVAVELTAKEMVVRFVNVHQKVLKEVRIEK